MAWSRRKSASVEAPCRWMAIRERFRGGSSELSAGMATRASEDGWACREAMCAHPFPSFGKTAFAMYELRAGEGTFASRVNGTQQAGKTPSPERACVNPVAQSASRPAAPVREKSRFIHHPRDTSPDPEETPRPPPDATEIELTPPYLRLAVSRCLPRSAVQAKREATVSRRASKTARCVRLVRMSSVATSQTGRVSMVKCGSTRRSAGSVRSIQ